MILRRGNAFKWWALAISTHQYCLFSLRPSGQIVVPEQTVGQDFSALAVLEVLRGLLHVCETRFHDESKNQFGF
jgi:hypothetical protein